MNVFLREMGDSQQQSESAVSRKKAFKQRLGFLTASREEKYLLFLKQQILGLEPKFYVVVHKRRVLTPDGEMFVVRITTDIEHPGFEPVAEGWINGRFIYLWRDHCWSIAVDDNNKQIIRYDDPVNADDIHSSYCNKTLLLFKIGIDEI